MKAGALPPKMVLLAPKSQETTRSEHFSSRYNAALIGRLRSLATLAKPDSDHEKVRVEEEARSSFVVGAT